MNKYIEESRKKENEEKNMKLLFDINKESK